MTFSIVTVTFNSERYLEETIESVLSQDFGDFEYLIIDGGSTDRTLDIIRRHAAKDSRLSWISEPDRGISDAFNKGIARAKGEIVGILNSDDTYAPWALRAVAEAYAARPECDVFHGDMLRFQGDTPLFLLKAGRVGENIWHGMSLNHPATFVTRRAYEKVGLFDPELKVAMDYDLALRLYTRGCRFHHIDRVLASMRYGGTSDDRFMDGLRELYAVTVREGYPRWKARLWFLHRVAMSSAKNILRRLGLHGLIRLHPRFRKAGARDKGRG
jgi:glycosyltransferase involved in cell wall biosynthesis